MLKKRVICGILAMLSFFVLGQTGCAFDFFGSNDNSAVAGAAEPRLKIYMPTSKTEPSGGVSEGRLTVKDTTKDIVLGLYDGDINQPVLNEETAEVTLDMGTSIMLSQIRYYAGELDEEGGNNCLGTRFYASQDNKKFDQLAVIEDEALPQNNWYDINFSGFGEYRYFKVVLPPKSNICELEWIGAAGFSRVRRGGNKYDIKFNLCAFDAKEATDATILIAAYNDKGMLKRIETTEQRFEAGVATNFEVVLPNADLKDGDSYRIIVLGEDGLSLIPKPLNYRVNGASRDFSVASVFSDNMILQAEKPVTVWGEASKLCEVEVSLENDLGGGVKRTVKPDNNSKWSAELGTFSSGGSYTLTVKSEDRTIEYKNITFGDIWLCTGQSNMDYYMAAGAETAEELKRPDVVKNANIRLLNLWNKGMSGAAAPIDNPPVGNTAWQEMNVDSAAYCSAVGYYFAREIFEATKEPVGIINVAVGDTEINRWINRGDKYGSFTSTDGDLYNNRIKPFEDLQIKGIILYQGEADQYRTHLTEEEYSDAMAGLVDNYREMWGEDLPFYWAQLTRYRVDESVVREGQRIALSKVKNQTNIGMIVLNDLIGNYKAKTGSCRNDIHPWGKKIVAERFASYAKRDCYGENTAVSGPVYKSLQIDGAELVLTFECDGKLRVMQKERYADKITDKKIKKEKIDTSKPMEFEIAGEDETFYPAEARLDGKNVVLSSDKVKEPLYARYAWGAYPEMPNLTDDTGLPTATFDTRND